MEKDKTPMRITAKKHGAWVVIPRKNRGQTSAFAKRAMSKAMIHRSSQAASRKWARDRSNFIYEVLGNWPHEKRWTNRLRACYSPVPVEIQHRSLRRLPFTDCDLYVDGEFSPVLTHNSPYIWRYDFSDIAEMTQKIITHTMPVERAEERNYDIVTQKRTWAGCHLDEMDSVLYALEFPRGDKSDSESVLSYSLSRPVFRIRAQMRSRGLLPARGMVKRSNHMRKKFLAKAAQSNRYSITVSGRKTRPWFATDSGGRRPKRVR